MPTEVVYCTMLPVRVSMLDHCYSEVRESSRHSDCQTPKQYAKQDIMCTWRSGPRFFLFLLSCASLRPPTSGLSVFQTSMCSSSMRQNWLFGPFDPLGSWVVATRAVTPTPCMLPTGWLNIPDKRQQNTHDRPFRATPKLWAVCGSHMVG